MTVVYGKIGTAKEQTHPQTKYLPWIRTCKTGQPNSFGYESRGSLEAHREALTACLAPVSSPGEPKAISLYGANMGAERVIFVVSYRSNDLISVVTFHAAVIASGSLTYLMGCGIASNDSYQVSYL